MSEDPRANFHNIIIQATQLVSDYFRIQIHFDKIIQLNEPGRRNNILRLSIANPTRGIPKTLILKNTAVEINVFETISNKQKETEDEQFDRFAHDWAGLEFLTELGSSHAPHFYCGSVEYKFIIIEDLGITHTSLVGPLTRANSPENRLEAENALTSYIKHIGRMHAETAGKFNQFKSILKRINPKASHYNSIPHNDSKKFVDLISFLTGNNSNELIEDIEEIINYSQSANQFHVLLHGDICPDNVFYQNGNLHLIDFEFADFGNALIDASYLRMHMPSCWCSKAVLIEIRDKMEGIYREALASKIVVAKDDTIYYKQLISACGYWLLRTINQIEQMSLMESEWICPSGPIDSDSKWDPEKNAFRPRIISRLDAFINCALNTGHYPKLLQASQQLLFKLRKQWPGVNDIELFPVFNSQKDKNDF